MPSLPCRCCNCSSPPTGPSCRQRGRRGAPSSSRSWRWRWCARPPQTMRAALATAMTRPPKAATSASITTTTLPNACVWRVCRRAAAPERRPPDRPDHGRPGAGRRMLARARWRPPARVQRMRAVGSGDLWRFTLAVERLGAVGRWWRRPAAPAGSGRAWGSHRAVPSAWGALEDPGGVRAGRSRCMCHVWKHRRFIEI
jgi:hypothetical protein